MIAVITTTHQRTLNKSGTVLAVLNRHLVFVSNIPAADILYRKRKIAQEHQM